MGFVIGRSHLPHRGRLSCPRIDLYSFSLGAFGYQLPHHLSLHRGGRTRARSRAGPGQGFLDVRRQSCFNFHTQKRLCQGPIAVFARPNQHWNTLRQGRRATRPPDGLQRMQTASSSKTSPIGLEGSAAGASQPLDGKHIGRPERVIPRAPSLDVDGMRIHSDRCPRRQPCFTVYARNGKAEVQWGGSQTVARLRVDPLSHQERQNRFGMPRQRWRDMKPCALPFGGAPTGPNWMPIHGRKVHHIARGQPRARSLDPFPGFFGEARGFVNIEMQAHGELAGGCARAGVLWPGLAGIARNRKPRAKSLGPTQTPRERSCTSMSAPCIFNTVLRIL